MDGIKGPGRAKNLEDAKSFLSDHRLRWLVTGAAGFIGSHLVERLLRLGQRVVGLDNYATGYRENVDSVTAAVGENAELFLMREGDITDYDDCLRASSGVDIVLHMAALGSVPRSMKDPLSTHRNNVEGFVNVLMAARENGIKRVVYASSSSVYGDSPELPKVEERIGHPLSPYALSKRMNEECAELYKRVFGMECIGLRYFNVFGPRQDPNGAYAAVIPRWFSALAKGERPVIFGDGQTSRDFCYIENVVAANILAALTEDERAFKEAFNIACGERTTLNELFRAIRELAPGAGTVEPIYEDFRPGDIVHSLASIEKAESLLGYEPVVKVREGLKRAARWYLKK